MIRWRSLKDFLDNRCRTDRDVNGGFRPDDIVK